MDVLGSRVRLETLGVQDIDRQDEGITSKEIITAIGRTIDHTRGGERVGRRLGGVMLSIKLLYGNYGK